MNFWDCLFWILIVLAICVTIIGVVGLEINSREKEQKIAELERQLDDLRRKNILKARKEREAKEKAEPITTEKKKTKKRGVK